MRRFLSRLALYGFHLVVVRPLLRWVSGVRYRRRNLVPKGPCLVVSNHNSHLDAAILMGLFPLRRLPHVHPVAAADYFGTSLLRRTLAMMLMNGIPIERKLARSNNPLSPIVHAIERGESLIFFPEGSRGEAGVVAPFRQGIGVLVHELPGLLVVPVYLSGPERVWPRGEYVPVPLGIDVSVGRPRTYPSDQDTRTIADRVRDDVLALAPPPPPVPGPRPAPPLRVTVCGIDEASRRAVHRAVTEALGRLGPSIGVDASVVEAGPNGLREIARPLAHPRGQAFLRVASRLFRASTPYRRERFVELIESARINESLEQGGDTRFVVENGSALVDLMAWSDAEFHRGVFDEADQMRLLQYLAGQKRIPLASWWSFLRKAPGVWWINILDLARPPLPRVLVLVHAPLGAVMGRLRSAGRPLDRHENESFLERLQESYAKIGRMLGRRRKVELIEVDAATDEPAEVAARVCSAAAALAEPPRAATPS